MSAICPRQSRVETVDLGTARGRRRAPNFPPNFLTNGATKKAVVTAGDRRYQMGRGIDSDSMRWRDAADAAIVVLMGALMIALMIALTGDKMAAATGVL